MVGNNIGSNRGNNRGARCGSHLAVDWFGLSSVQRLSLQRLSQAKAFPWRYLIGPLF